MTRGPQVPPTLKVGEIARACGISRGRCMTELRGARLLDRRGGWWVSSSALRERLPDHFEKVYEHFVLLFDDSERSRRKRTNPTDLHDSDRPPP